jgi:hypothetical protein
MALYSFQIRKNDAGDPLIALILRSGAPLASLLSYKNKDSGVDLSLESQAAAFEKLEDKYFRARAKIDKQGGNSGLQMSREGVERVAACASSIEDGRTGLIDLQSVQSEKRQALVDHLKGWLEDRGHAVLDETQTRDGLEQLGMVPPVRVDIFQAPEDGLSLRLHPMDVPALKRQLGREKINATLKCDREGASLHLDRPEEMEKVLETLTRELVLGEKARQRVSIINFTNHELKTDRDPVVIHNRPTLISGERGVELHVLSGNALKVANRIRDGFGGFQDQALHLKGTKDVQRKSLKALVGERWLADEGAARKHFDDIKGQSPKTAVVSASLNSERVKLGADVADPVSVDRVIAFTDANPGVLTQMQQKAVAFGISKGKALFSHDAGGGKTRMLAASAELAMPVGEKALVVASTTLLKQWIQEIADRIPLSTLSDPAAALPPWIQRLEPTSRSSEGNKATWSKLVSDYRKVCSRFEFLPASALKSGLEFRGGLVAVPAIHAENGSHRTAKSRMDFALSRGPYGALLIDEIQNYRSSENASKWLERIRDGEINGPTNHGPIAGKEIKRVFAASATPAHCDARDIGQILRIIGVRGFKTLDKLEFCKRYCELNYKVESGSWVKAQGSSPYDYGRFRDDMLPEVTSVLNKVMDTATLEEIAPGGFKPQRIYSPLPYEAPSSGRPAIKNLELGGEMIPVDGTLRAALGSTPNPTSRAILRATAKAPYSVREAKKVLEEHGPHSKAIIWTVFHDSANALREELNKEGVPHHYVTGACQTSSAGDVYPDKADAIAGFIAAPESKVLVATIGAVSEGVDGLQHVCPVSIFNDFSRIAGDQVQAQGRNSRLLKGKDTTFSSPTVAAKYMALDETEELKRYEVMLDRLHTLQFVREQKLLTEIDSEGARIEVAGLRDRFRSKMQRLGLNLKPSRSDAELAEMVRQDVAEEVEPALVVVQERHPDRTLNAAARSRKLIEQIQAMDPDIDPDR